MKITSTPEAAAVRSRRDGVMWLWKVHNEVNARLKTVRWVAVGAIATLHTGSTHSCKMLDSIMSLMDLTAGRLLAKLKVQP